MSRQSLRSGQDMANTTGLEHTQSTASGRKRKTYDALEYTRNRMGLRPAVAIESDTVNAELSWWPRIRLIFREPLLEFWGTLVMMLLGGSVSAITYLSDYQFGDWLTICFGWSAAMIFGIYVAGDSGAYLNPAITLTNCLFRGLPLRRWPVYAAAQFLGAFCGHGLVYANYISAIDQYEGHGIRTIPPNPTTSAKIFCQFPQPFVPLFSQIFSEFIANFFMTFLILAVRDENGADLKGGGWFVFAFFWLNFVVMAAFGWQTGSPINPARDFTGRTWLAILGYKNAWSAYNHYFWIPFFIPFLACFLGALAYDIFIYTGDSPINNGAWSPTNIRKEFANLFRGDSRGHQSDEESLDATKDHEAAASTPVAGDGEHNPSSPSRQGTESGNTHRATAANRQQERGDDKARGTEQPGGDTQQRKKNGGQILEGTQGKKTGYDDPHQNATDPLNDGKEE
ncbi:aquaporin-3 [Diaporthe helianthi]|uniref:Aquaporin-3 n=1 Tax=Diaporthe helianthi TaxID=158607 RepID=A0A2P5I7C2_DIAHE|nr:aquaporin-3 [Diaporthe helianthi]